MKSATKLNYNLMCVVKYAEVQVYTYVSLPKNLALPEPRRESLIHESFRFPIFKLGHQLES